MSWTFEDINARYLCRQQLAATPEQLEVAFDRCERMLGIDWIYEHFKLQVGAFPVLHVLNLGSALGCVEGVPNSDVIIMKLKQGDNSGFSELYALQLLMAAGGVQPEIEPMLIISGHERKPDYRIRREGEDWLYIEVTRPENSELYHKSMPILERLIALCSEIPRAFELDIFFRRVMTPQEEITIVDEVRQFCLTRTSGVEELRDGLAILTLADYPKDVILRRPEYVGKEYFGRLCLGTVKHDNGRIQKISARLPVTDDRAEEFIRRKSAQLPPQGPGLLMIDVNKVIGGFKKWEPLILRRFQPSVNKRFSAICLFSRATLLTLDGHKSMTQIKLLVNPFAQTPLPIWLQQSLIEQGREYDEAMTT